MKNYLDVIRLWPTLDELASDTGKSYESVRQWMRRKSIPPINWPIVAEAAARRNFPVDLQLLADLSKKQKRDGVRA